MSGTCYRCFKAKEACLCPYIKELDTSVKFVILIHPVEARHERTGTGRLAHLSLKDSELIVGVDFNQNERVKELMEDPQYFPVLLYPGEDAFAATDTKLKEALGNRKLLVFVVDGTWAQAKKMLKLSTCLHTLPKLSFRAGYRTRFVFKKEPQPDYISTIESCHYLVKELATVGIARDEGIENLMSIFDRMVAFQLESEKARRLVEGDGPQHAHRPGRKELERMAQEAGLQQ